MDRFNVHGGSIALGHSVRGHGRADRHHASCTSSAVAGAVSGWRPAARPGASGRRRGPGGGIVSGGAGAGPRALRRERSSRSRCGATASPSSRSTTSREPENTITDGAAGAAPGQRSRRIEEDASIAAVVLTSGEAPRLRRRREPRPAQGGQVRHRRRAHGVGAGPGAAEARGRCASPSSRPCTGACSGGASSSRSRATRSSRATTRPARVARGAGRADGRRERPAAGRSARRATCRDRPRRWAAALRAAQAKALVSSTTCVARAILLDAAARHAKALVGHVPPVRRAADDSGA